MAARTGAGSRAKGRDAEREVECVLREAGFDVDRAIGGRSQIHADVIGVEGIALEVKRRERVRIVEWSREIESKTPPHVTPAVAYRANREPWRVSLPLSDLIDLLKEARR